MWCSDGSQPRQHRARHHRRAQAFRTSSGAFHGPVCPHRPRHRGQPWVWLGVRPAELLGRGAAVYAGALNPGQVDLPGAKPIALDITDPASVAAAVQATGDVTVLINNAVGPPLAATCSQATSTHTRLEMDTHYFGTLSMWSGAFAPQIAANGGGAILNILSVLVLGHLPAGRGLRRGQVGGMVADQRPARAARPGRHPGQRAVRRLHGHRHGRPP